ncbi:MAG: transporter [Proteobacteria bacterium]|nr:transporter [Pseudomonadota bacterium]
MRSRCSAAVLGLAAMTAGPLAYADDDGVMTTDRPDFSESSEVVGKGHFQIETGPQWDKSHDGGLKATLATTPTLLRLGISDTWELRVETDGYADLRVRDDATGATTRSHGFSDTAFGVKWHAQDGDDDDDKPSIAWLLHLDADTGSPAFRGRGVRPSLRMVAEWELPHGYSFGVMPGVFVDTNADGHRYTAGLLALALEKDWTRAFHGFVEFAAQQVASAANGGSILTLDVGASYLVTNTFQIDASVYRGLNRYSPDWVFATGVSIKF